MLIFSNPKSINYPLATHHFHFSYFSSNLSHNLKEKETVEFFLINYQYLVLGMLCLFSCPFFPKRVAFELVT